MRKLLFILSTVILICSFGPDDAGLFSMAHEYYQKGDYPAARNEYQRLVDAGYSTTTLHYNLANCYYKTNELGYAILHYEKALLYSPNDTDILFNIEKANRKQVDEIIEIPQFFLKRWWDGIRKWFSSGVWTSFGLLLLWAAVAGICYWLIGAEREKRKKAFVVGNIFAVLSLVFILLGRSSYLQQTENTYAVIVSKKTAFNVSPDIDSEVKFELHEGLKVEVLDQIGESKKIRLPNGDAGWVIINALQKI